MRLKNILVPAAFILIWGSSCQKNIPQRALNFDVESQNIAKQPSTTFKIGDTVNFVFSGNPDHITFYSGEIGRKFSNIAKTSDANTKNTLSFSTALNTAGNGTLQLLISNNFEAYTQVNTIDSVNAIKSFPSNWTDITDRASLATNATTKASGPISLTDYAELGKPVYLAFRYRAEAALLQAKWTISEIKLTHETADTTYIINTSAIVTPATFPAFTVSDGWGTINVLNKLIKFAPNTYSGGGTLSLSSNAATANFVITGNTDPATSVATENWIVTGPIDLSKVLPDNGVAIKDMTSNATTTGYGGAIPSPWASYTYIFKKRGTYDVTFLASTSSVNGQNAMTKTISIKVQ